MLLKAPLVGGPKGSQIEYRPAREGGTDKSQGRSGPQGGRTTGKAESSWVTWPPGGGEVLEEQQLGRQVETDAMGP